MKETIAILALAVLALAVLEGASAATGLAGLGMQGPPANAGEQHTIGPSAEEQACMMDCAVEQGCTPMDFSCMTAGKSSACQAKCNVQKPESTPETSCMEACVVEGCGEFDFACHATNQAKCEQECNMVKEPPAKNAEEQCIRDCVNREAPGTICSASQQEETGGPVCQQCANECVHLYEGPCINEETIRARQSACQTCEHCYGEPVNGPSGEGWDCIVDVECKDASNEFGDNPGSGPEVPEGMERLPEGNEQPSLEQQDSGILAPVTNAVSDVAEAIGDFFSSLFGG